jgi:hypothetical protein
MVSITCFVPRAFLLAGVFSVGAKLQGQEVDSVVIYGKDPVSNQEKVKIDRTAAKGKPVIEVISAAASTAINPAAALAQKPVVDALTQKGIVAERVEAGRKAISEHLPKSNYSWKRNIVTTVFYIGQGASGYNDMKNYQSAWDGNWTRNYGGADNQERRDGYVPKSFAPRLNPFYIALPFNDVKYPELSARYVPWWDKELHKKARFQSQCKGRWVQIRSKEGKVCFAQWEDVGPFRYDHAGYVFGNERPNTYNKAGLDVSPSVRDYLGLSGLDICDWRFVEDHEVPNGPWVRYAEQALLFVHLEREAKKKASTPASKAATVAK